MQYIYLNVEWSYGRITRLGGVFRLMAQDGTLHLTLSESLVTVYYHQSNHSPINWVLYARTNWMVDEHTRSGD
jgi:hypothetical protein